jgi:hypothetical protein
MTGMRSIAMALLVAWLLPAVPSYGDDNYDEAINIFDCGLVQKRNTSYQYGRYAWLEYIVETQGLLNLCGQYVVKVEASVVGVNSSASTNWGFYAVTVRRPIPVPFYGPWTTRGRHWVTIALLGPGFHDAGHSVSTATVVAPAGDGDSGETSETCALDGRVVEGDRCNGDSPLIVDMNHDGYRLTSLDEGVWFDLDADGTPERVAWTVPDGDEAFLAMDRNGNGYIDSGAELFGNHTPTTNISQSDVTALNGFEALRFSEGSSFGWSQSDGVIDARDAVFSRLVLWRDLNHNGISEPGELQPLCESDLVQIDTDYKTSRRRDRFGNEFRQRAPGIWRNGKARDIYDVWLLTGRD